MVNKLKTLFDSILILTLLFIAFIVLTKPARADNIIFQDDFNNNIIGNEWVIKNYNLANEGSYGEQHPLTIIESGEYLTIEGNGSDDSDWYGRSLITQQTISTDGAITILSKVKITGNNGYAVHLTIEFDAKNRIVASVGQILGENKAAHLALDENSFIRLAAPELLYNFNDDTEINLKLIFNPLSKQTSFYIGNLLIAEDDYYDGLINNPHVGLASSVRFGENSSIVSTFDNFKVYTTGDSTNNLNVPDVKQYDSSWGTLEYDHANNWFPSNPSITRWGCALTSATMVLNYHGHDTDTKRLNEWLKSQKDGYTRNGGVMWPAISRWTKTNGQEKPILEFSYHNPSNAFIANEIENSLPPILKMQKANGNTHFLVAKGKNGTDFNINDPASNSDVFNLLSQAKVKWGDNVKVGRFKPSTTDLSYIVLMIDKGFEIKVSSPSGNLIEEGYQTEGPIVAADDENVNSGESLNTFYLPKPENGVYEIQVDGEGIYQLDYYLYDQEGNVKLGNSFGTIGTGDTDVLAVDFNKDNFDNSVIPEVTFNSLLGFWDDVHQEDKITNHGFYNSIKQIIENALKNKDKGNGFASQVLLKVVLQKVKLFTPQFISEDASMYFQKQIEILIKSL